VSGDYKWGQPSNSFKALFRFRIKLYLPSKHGLQARPCTYHNLYHKMTIFAFPSVLWHSRLSNKGHTACKKLGVGGDNLTGALHVLRFKLLPPLTSSLASIKPANPGWPGKMAIKNAEREYFAKTHHQQTQICNYIISNTILVQIEPVSH